jgi:hypothetical protein
MRELFAAAESRRDVGWARFLEAFQSVANPSLVHEFTTIQAVTKR